MTTQKKYRCGIIGLGLMGREFASVASRWSHLTDIDARPLITAICDKNESLFEWFEGACPELDIKTTNYNDLLQDDRVDVIYCAVPHHLHEKLYTDIIQAGKHLMGEKPFGIDLKANDSILKVIGDNPEVFVRCSSEFPFFPAVIKIMKYIKEKRFGTILEVNCGFLHSSDLDPEKPINWKRMIEFNGEYGCLGDLGMHALHVPLRVGWFPDNIRAVLSNVMTRRPDGKGNTVPCKTWDNATLLCKVTDPNGMGEFPMNVKIERIAPGEMDTWYLEVLGTEFSARYSTKNPKSLATMTYNRETPQSWEIEDTGYTPIRKTITGGIFEFGFCDALLQMWAAFFENLHDGGREHSFFSCVLPEETHLSHRILTASLDSHREQKVISL